MLPLFVSSLFCLLAPCFPSTEHQNQFAIKPQYNHDLHSFHKSLVEIPSVTGTEHEIGLYLASYLRGRGFTIETQLIPSPQYPGEQPRYNVYAYAEDCPRRTPVLLTSHMDTVPPFYPYERDESILRGRGVVDAKAAIAAQTTALLSLTESHSIPLCSTSLLFVSGEERFGDGMRNANNLNTSWDAVIFGEPTENHLAAGHKGISAFKLMVKGNSGHSGYPWLAVSANELLTRALAGLMDLAEGKRKDGKALPQSQKYGNTTLNLGKVEGGVAPNVMAEVASAEVTLRLAGGTTREVRAIVERTVHDATREQVNRAHDEGKNASVSIEWVTEGYAPVDVDTDADVWSDEEPITVNYGTDVPNLKGNHKRYLYGPGSILVAHSDHEALDINELERGVEGYKRLLMSVLKKIDSSQGDPEEL